MKLATLLMTLIAAGASAKTPPPPITVCSVGCDFPTIQNAVDAAASGTTISVSDGTYVENVSVNEVSNPKKFVLTIEGLGAGVTIVDGSGASSVFAVVGSKAIVTLRGMTIQNGLAPGTGTVTPTEGGGVFAGLGAAVTVDTDAR
jgi:pectin methylesterase-like acyl-CoA thioesterase